MSTAYSLDVGSLTTLTCGIAGCGIAFAIPSVMESARRQDGKSFYCPNGHHVAFGNSENARLKRELEQKQKKLEWETQAKLRAQEDARATEKRRRAEKGAHTKTKKRIAAGRCPHCSATFPDLATHMRGHARPENARTPKEEALPGKQPPEPPHGE